MAYPIYLLRCICPALIDDELIFVIKVHNENCPDKSELVF
jgi:hypothetical protein